VDLPYVLVQTTLARTSAFLSRHRFLVAFAALSSVMGVSVGIAKVTTSLYAVHLGAQGALLGMVAASQTVGILAMSIPLGFLVDTYGPRRLFLVGTLVAGSLYFFVPLVSSPNYLIACTSLIGCFMPFRFVSLNTVFMEQLMTLGEAKAGWYRGTHMAGTFLVGPVLAATAVSWLGFSGTYWTIAALFAVTILMSPAVFGQVQHTRARRGAMRWSEVRAQLVLIVRDVDLRGACMAEFTAQGITMFYGFFIVVIGITELGLDPQQASGLVGAQGLSYVFALFALGGFSRRLGQIHAYLLSACTIVSALLLLGTGERAPALFVGGALLGLGVGLLQIVNLTRFARIGARLGRGKIAGLNALVGPAGGMIGNLCGGLLGSTLGLRSVFLVFIPLVGLLGWQLIVSHRGLLTDTQATD
jgi:MFS family permease